MSRFFILSCLACSIASGASTSAPTSGQTPAPTATRPDVAQAIAELSSEDPAVRYRAISQLAGWEAPEATEPLKELLASEAGAGVRGRALVALAEIKGPEVLEACLDHADDEEADLRAAAIEALGILGSSEGQAAVEAGLNDPHVDVRNQAVVAIAELRKREAWPIVRPLLKHGDPKVVRHAARALTRIGDAQAQDELIWLVDHPDVLVRLEAIRGLKQFANPQAFPKLLERLARDPSWVNRTAAEEALAAYSADVRKTQLLEVLRSDRSEFHPAAMRLLTIRPDEETCATIASLLARSPDRYAGVLPEALDLLGAFDAEKYQELFLSHLHASDPGVRRRAVRYCALSPNVDHFARLRSAVSDADPRVRAEALVSLGAATTGAPEGGILAYLSDSLESDDRDTFRRATELLAQRITPAELGAGLGALEKILGGADGQRRRLAARALGELADRSARRQIATAQGCVTHWRIIGPFPSDPNDRGLGVAYPPESEINFARAYPEQRFGYGAVFEPVGDGEALRLVAPTQRPGGRVSATWNVELPSQSGARLLLSVACEGAKEDAGSAHVSVKVGGDSLLQVALGRNGGIRDATLPLSDFAGPRVPVELVLASVGDRTAGAILVSRLAIVAEGAEATDLVGKAGEAIVRTELPGQVDREIRWRTHEVADTTGEVALDVLIPEPSEYSVAYALTELRADQAGPVWLDLDTDDGAALWLNGEEALRSREKVSRLLPVQLAQGRNRLLLKVANRRGRWRYHLRVVDADGRRREGVTDVSP